jgi:excisionase family DNA binding protein
MMPSKKLTVKEVADLLEASRSTVTLWCRQGKFPSAEKIVTPFGDHWEIPESDLAGVEIKMGRPKRD